MIAALRAALGPQGTLVMPSFADDDDQPFVSSRTPCCGVGIVADTFWRIPGVARSDSPHAFAAIGPEAEAILQPHPVERPHCADSPVGRVHALNGQILLLGVGHDANTTIHLAESLAGVRYRRAKHATVVKNSRPQRIAFAEIDHCCARFALMEDWLDAECLQSKSHFGHGEARLMHANSVVDIALDRLKADETVFLHEFGVDHECDEALASLSAAKPQAR